jgi:hypothetical protein
MSSVRDFRNNRSGGIAFPNQSGGSGVSTGEIEPLYLLTLAHTKSDAEKHILIVDDDAFFRT